MKIYTGYFGLVKNIPDNVLQIAICGKSPNWYKGLEYKKLAPKYWFFKEWKDNQDNDFYIKNYKKEVLDKLDATQVISDFLGMSENKDVILLCYERPMEFCHRHLVAEWLSEYYPETIGEYIC